jgi:hypothetical protein
VDLLVNDLSLVGQLPDLASFREAIERLITIRDITRRFGRDLYVHQNMLNAQVTPTMSMPQAVQSLALNERRALLQWITRQGPFWTEARRHGSDDWLECNGTIVTDTAVGEAAWCCLNAIQRGLVSFSPSDWIFTPIPVDWLLDDETRRNVNVSNYWQANVLEEFLRELPAPLTTWERLEGLATTQCTQLTFAENAFEPLRGQPFSSSAAQRVFGLLRILDQLRGCFDEDGKRTAEGHDLYQQFFTGKKGNGGRGAMFSDSSDDEKQTFESEMTFRDPSNNDATIFCSWHGKVQTPQLRVHFSYPIRADEPLFIVYVGPKLTKR